MRKHVVFVAVLLMLFIFGCGKQAPIYEDDAVEEEPPVEEEVVHVLEPEEEVVEEPEEAEIEGEKQLAVGGATDIKEEEPSIITGLKCEYGAEGPIMFSFKITNIEDMKLKFSALSYGDREISDNPIVVLNALQVTNGQMIYACGSKTINPGSTVTCDFNLESPEHVLVKKHLRTGVTPLGSVNENSLSFRTSGHVAEVTFLCE